MGSVICLDDYRRTRTAPAPAGGAPIVVAPVVRTPVTFAFDLRSVWTYLAAERVDRAFRDVRWLPAMLPGALGAPTAAERELAVTRAGALRMPLVWPERDVAGLGAMRVAAYAADAGRATAFVLAAGRLAYCGGFDLDDPEILAEAAAAACLPIEGCIDAFGDRSRDAALQATGERLVREGAGALPALRVGDRWFAGEDRLAEASAAAAQPTAAIR